MITHNVVLIFRLLINTICFEIEDSYITPSSTQKVNPSIIVFNTGKSFEKKGLDDDRFAVY